MKLRTLIPACVLLASSALAPAQASAAEPILRFAILGDAEPKPKAEFPGLAAAVGHVNHLSDTLDLDFVIGVGDIAHKGTELQYEAVTPVLQRLTCRSTRSWAMKSMAPPSNVIWDTPSVGMKAR
ncbi:hypothetical protein [Pseudomonas sp. OIL-1]|uniref:hypothetical protein n=1 Tax=Pseudomonas sp. OIL-1 TaxID=2706126 RepID=UPI001C498934|nr:hypothetical protein [Pseudomonas sp. OIL-1]